MSDLELLKRYLQNEIDDGNHKLFAFDKNYNTTGFKIIDVLNEINDLQNQLQQKENIIKEAREYFKNHTLKYDDLMLIKPSDVLEILDKENKNENN